MNKDYQASYPAQGSDHSMYYDTSINILVHDIHSYDKENVEKSFYRDPLYPYLLSIFIKFQNLNIESLDKCKFKANKNEIDCKKTLNSIGLFNKINYLIFFLLVIFISRKLFRQNFPIISFLILTNPLYEGQIIQVFTELLSSTLFLVYSFLLFLICAKGNNKYLNVFLSSVFFSALLLTKSVYFYLIYIYLIIIILFLAYYFLYRFKFLNSFYSFINLKKLFLHLIIAISLIMPWQLRNVAEFGEYKISDRSSGVLSLRAEVFDINKKEYAHGFKYWLPDGKLRNYLLKGNEHLSIKFDDRSDNVYAWWNRHNKRYGLVLSRISLSNIKNNPIITNESINLFKENFFLNIALSFLFFYKSLFIEFEYLLLYKVITWILPILFIFAFLETILKREKSNLLIFYLPTLFHICIYSFFTYYEPRYNLVIIPIIWISFFYLFRNKIEKT